MKHLVNKMMIAASLLSATGAWAQSTSQTSAEINSQSTLTRAAIDNVIQRMSEQRPSSAFRASDYYAQTVDFKNALNAVLVKFEDTLTKDIFPKAAFWMDQYNAVYTSSDFSPEQKKMLLAERLKSLTNQFKVLSADYAKALKGVYALVPLYDLALSYSNPYSSDLCSESDSDSVSVGYATSTKAIGPKVTFNFRTYDRKDGGWGHYNIYYVDVSRNGTDVLKRLEQNYSWMTQVGGTVCKNNYRKRIDYSAFFRIYKTVVEPLEATLYNSAYPAIKAK